jgi:hypothetical protein
MASMEVLEMLRPVVLDEPMIEFPEPRSRSATRAGKPGQWPKPDIVNDGGHRVTYPEAEHAGKDKPNLAA